MELIPYVVAYVALGIFAVAVVARFLMWSRMPMHVRWELYPVAHEGSRAHYGGSYLEDVGWWNKPREVNKVSEMKHMIPEILFLVALRRHNRKMWVRSYPFHLGLYLVIACTVLMLGAGVISAAAPTVMAGAVGQLWQYAIISCGAAGLALGLFGALGLLQRRLTDAELKDFTTPADIFNLLFFVVAFGLGLVTIALADHDLSRTTAFVASLVSFGFAAEPFAGGGLQTALPVATVVALGALMAYIPLTHMSHFVGKFFAYHAIRWNDTPNLRGGDQEAAIGVALQRPVSWAAPHINGDGKRSWADVATEEVPHENA